MKALVLSGGGSKGSYQIGVWKALRKLHIKYDIVTGTSVGALNGALITQKSYWRALSLWKKINLKILFDEDSVDNEKISEIYKMYGNNFLKNGGMDTKSLETIIAKSLNKKKFYHSNINYGLITFNLSNKKPVQITKKEIPEKHLIDYLIASASCYPAFKQKEIDGKKYIDGGIYDNLPINLAIDMGAEEIIAVDLKAPGIKQTPKKKIKTTIIKPNNKLTNFLNFYEEGSKRNMKFGYNDTMKAFHKLEGHKYTFKKGHIEKNKKKYQETYKYIMKKILNSKTLTKSFEELLKLTPTAEEELINKILLRIMEQLGKSFNLEETTIYSYKKFNRLLKKNLKEKLSHPQQGNKILKTKKNEIELYEELKKQNYKEIRKLALLNPMELLKAIYLYTICEE